MKKKLKHMVGGCLIIGMIGLGLTGCGNSNTSAPGAAARGTGNGRAFVDANRDGICDNSGKRMGRGMGAGKRSGFYDANNDGICDRTGRRIATNRN